MIVWYLPSKRMLWRPTASPQVNATFIDGHPDALLVHHPENLDESLKAQLAYHPGTLVSVYTHQPDDLTNV